nr:3-hydroxyacyl-ACP dehydratase FabZ [Blastocatellia bacterium]
MTIYDSVAIREILPHRYPFLMVDKIIELEPKTRIVGIKQVTMNEHFFVGHFPEAPVMPGVLQIEALAQVGAILALREFEDRGDKIPFFSGIESAKFRRPVVP